MNRSVFYLRYSSDQQDGATIETQRHECTQKATQLGMTVVGEYVDTAQSGRVEDRPQFQRMIAEAKRKPRPFETIIVRKFDRFARDVAVSRTYKACLKALGVRVVSVHEDVDNDTAAGNLLETLLEGVAEFFSRNLAAETISGMETNCRRGFRSGGTAPYGYRNKRIIDTATGKQRTVLDVHPDEAPVVQHMFRRYAEGAGMNTIIAEFNERGWRPRRAAGWTENVLHYLFRYETYIGTLVWRKKKDPATWIRTANAVPRLVDDETFAKVQRRLDANRAIIKPRSVSQSEHPLSGMVFCSKCDGRYVIASKRQGTEWYMACRTHRDQKSCPNRRYIEEIALVQGIKDILVKHLLTPAFVRDALDAYKTEIQAGARDGARDIQKLERQIRAIRNQESALLDALTTGDLPRDAIRHKLLDLATQRENLTVNLNKTRAHVAEASTAHVTEADIEAATEVLRSRIAETGGRDLRTILETLRVRIVVHDDRVEVETAPDVIGGGPNGIGAGSGTRTHMGVPIRPSNVRVYQFHHPGKAGRDTDNTAIAR